MLTVESRLTVVTSKERERLPASHCQPLSPASGERWERRTGWRYSAFRRRSRETEPGRGSWERGGNSVSKTNLPSRFVMIFSIRSPHKNPGNWFGCFVKDSQHKVHLVIWGGRRPADRREAGGGWHICHRYRLQVIQTTISPEESCIFPSLALPFFCSVVRVVWVVWSQQDLSPRKEMRGSSTPSSRREGRATPSTLSTPRLTLRGSESECWVQCQTEGQSGMFYRPGLSQILPAEPGQTRDIKRHKSLPPKQRRKSGLNVSEKGAEGASSYYYGNSDTDNRPSEVKILSSPAECFIHYFIF